MKKTDEILNIAYNHNGFVTASMVSEAGILRGNLKYLADIGKLQLSERGVYTLPEVWDDEFFAIQNRFKRGIFCCDTALFLWGMTDRTPNKFRMTFPSTYNVTNAKKEGIICSQVVKHLYELGLTEVETPSHNIVRVYNRERTLCDILRKTNQTDIQIITQAFKEYAKLPDKNIPLLSEYSKLLRVGDKVRSYLEVLL